MVKMNDLRPASVGGPSSEMITAPPSSPEATKWRLYYQGQPLTIDGGFPMLGQEQCCPMVPSFATANGGEGGT